MLVRRWQWSCAALVALSACGDDRPEQPRLPGGIVRQELRAATPAAAGEPRFRRVPVDESGLAFTNELRRENRYTYLTNGAGLAVGDYDGDGLLDAYLVSQDGSNKLFRQTAPLRFEDVTAAAGGVGGGDAWGTGASFADVDGDGDLDLYVCNLEANNLLYVNQGDGTFVEDAARFGLDIAAASMMCAFADYDRDGRLDLYLLTNRALHPGWWATPDVLDGFRVPDDTLRTARQMVPTAEDQARVDALGHAGALNSSGDIPEHLREHFFVFEGKRFIAGQPDRLLRNVAGRFVDVTTSAGIADHGMGLSATWFDYDDDGYPDLYVANDLESPDMLYHNLRNGRFAEVAREVVPHTAYYGMGSDAADVDGDGRLDLMVADMSMTTHQKAKILMGDMGDRRDVLMKSRPPQVMRNALLLNDGLGRFQEAAKLAGVSSTDWTWSVLFGDLDHDGRVDLFATNGIARFEMNPDFQMKVQELWQQGRQQAAIELIQNVPKVIEKNVALRNAGDLQFEKTGSDWGLDLESVSHGAALADFDGDGDLDVLVHNYNEPAALFENRAANGAAIVVRLRGQASERFGVGARVTVTLPDGERLVRELTLARGYLSGQAPELHFGCGDAAAVTVDVAWPSGHAQTFAQQATGARYTITEPPGAPPARDENDDGDPTDDDEPLFAAADAPPFTHRENDFDEYAAQPLLPAEVSRLGPALAAHGDLVFVGGAFAQAGAMFRLGDDRQWQPVEGPWQKDRPHEDVGACFLDYDGDGDADLFVTSGGAEVEEGDPRLVDRLYRNDDGTYRRAAFPDVRTSSGHATAGDYDGDGDPDLLVCGRIVPGSYPDAPPTRLFRNDGGAFVDVTADVAPALLDAGMVTDALFTDVDGDGALDLLIAAQWQPIRHLHNQDGAFVDRTEAAGLAQHRGWWNALHAVDVDGDGDLDYLAGNQGWNTKYKASAAKPARLFFGDFDDNGTRDLVEAKYEGDRLLPVRGRSCSSGAMPALKERFPTYRQFARSTLGDIYSDEKLQQCGELVATELASCLMRNGGDGTFTIEPLPRRAQIAPIFGFASSGDYVLCAQNHFAPEPETGRHDGGTGLVLRFVDGAPVVLAPHEHGISAFGDHKACVALPCTDGKAVLFARNDGALHMWTRTKER